MCGQEELAVLRLKLSQLVDENKRLHTELKTTVVHEIIRDGGDLVKVSWNSGCSISCLFTSTGIDGLNAS